MPVPTVGTDFGATMLVARFRADMEAAISPAATSATT
jgi:hypothetical protein